MQDTRRTAVAWAFTPEIVGYCWFNAGDKHRSYWHAIIIFELMCSLELIIMSTIPFVRPPCLKDLMENFNVVVFLLIHRKGVPLTTVQIKRQDKLGTAGTYLQSFPPINVKTPGQIWHGDYFHLLLLLSLRFYDIISLYHFLFRNIDFLFSLSHVVGHVSLKYFLHRPSLALFSITVSSSLVFLYIFWLYSTLSLWSLWHWSEWPLMFFP